MTLTSYQQRDIVFDADLDDVSDTTDGHSIFCGTGGYCRLCDDEYEDVAVANEWELYEGDNG